MPSIAQIAQAMRTILMDQASLAARMSGFVQRERQITGAQFVQTVVGSFLASRPRATKPWSASRPILA